MNREDALRELRSVVPHRRLVAARALLELARDEDYHALGTARSIETVRWIRTALDAVLERRRRSLGAATDVTDEAPIGEEAVRREVEAVATQNVTRLLLHEIEPLVGVARLKARSDIPDFDASETRVALDQLSELLAAIGTLNRASGAPRIEEFDLAPVVASAIDVMSTQRVAPTSSGPGPFFVKADRALIKVALVNGLRNAVEAVQATGKEPSTSSVVVNWGCDDRGFWIVVLDNGAGLTPGCPDVFGIGVSTKLGHFGMGLATVRRAMWSLGGTAELTQQEPAGCRLELRWPGEAT